MKACEPGTAAGSVPAISPVAMQSYLCFMGSSGRGVPSGTASGSTTGGVMAVADGAPTSGQAAANTATVASTPARWPIITCSSPGRSGSEARSPSVG